MVKAKYSWRGKRGSSTPKPGKFQCVNATSGETCGINHEFRKSAEGHSRGLGKDWEPELYDPKVPCPFCGDLIRHGTLEFLGACHPCHEEQYAIANAQHEIEEGERNLARLATQVSK